MPRGDVPLIRIFRFRTASVVLALSASLIAMPLGFGEPGQLSTYAGGGDGEGSPALESPFISPAGMTVDDAGAVYVADQGGHRIKRISLDGTTRTIAGTGTAGFSGDGGPATAATLRHPADVAVDSEGSVYVADYGNDRIRKIDPSGVITTIAGGLSTLGIYIEGMPPESLIVDSPSAVEVLADGWLAFTNSGRNTVVAISNAGETRLVAGTGKYGSSGDGGPATSARLSFPQGLAATSSGELFIADTYSNTIRQIDRSGIITRVAGGGNEYGDGVDAKTAVLLRPRGLHFRQGHLYIADSYHHRIRVLRPDGTIELLAGSGTSCQPVNDDVPATQVCLASPTGVVALSSDSVLATAPWASRVIRISADRAYHYAGNGSSVFLGDGLPARQAVIMQPHGLDLGPDGSLYVAERQRGRIRRISPEGVITTFAGTTPGLFGDGGPAKEAGLNRPSGVAVAPDGSVYIADTQNRLIRRVDLSGVITTVAGSGTSCCSPNGIPATQAFLYEPMDVRIGPEGHIYIADAIGKILRVDGSGMIWTVAGTAERGFGGDGGSALEARLNSPTSIDFNSAGELFIADTRNHRIRKVTADGIISTVAGSGQTIAGDVPNQGAPAVLAHLYNPGSVRLDALDRIFIADTGNHQVHIVDASGNIHTIAGGPLYDDRYGDGGDARLGHLHYPSGLALTERGDVFISDSDPTHWMIRLVTGPIS